MYVSVDGEKIEMNPQQLYQRLLVAGIGTIDVQTLFQYELCSYPTSLFDHRLRMRRADKADLQNCLVRRVPTCVTDYCPTGGVYVVDGGAMLQRLPWPKSATYIDICKLYIHYVQCT